MARFGEINAQYFDDAGDPLGGGKIYFYESGTTTPKTTYADVNFTIPNTNPVVLTAAGRQPNVFFNGNAKAILTDSNDVQILARDPVGETASNFGDPWVATRIYSTNSVVIGSDGVYYRSLVPANQNNNPVTTSGYWALLYSVEWNAGITYQEGAVVTYDGEQYQSLQGSNLNQNPSIASSYWVLLSFAWISTATYADNQNAVGTDGILYTSQQAANTGNDPTDPANRPTWWVGTSADAAASAAAAAASEAAAAASEAAAETAEVNAETAQAAAEAAQAAAETAEVNAETAETNSAASAASSATSASASAASAAAALVSEGNASTSASNSASSATASAASAAAALVSENASAASEAAAAASESAAAASEAASASSASDSATSAAASASSATDSANSATAASGSATAASGSATAAAGSATAASGSASAAATSASNAAASFDEFDDIYLGAKASAPTVDNDGDPLIAGALYFNTVSNTMFVYSGSSWAAAGSAVNGTAERQEYVATSGQTNFSATYDVGFVDVYLNGSKLIPTTDFTATDGATVILSTGATTGDNVSIIAYGAFNVADVYTQAQSDARYAQIANVYDKTDSDARYTQQSNNLSDLDNAATALTNLGLTATAAELNYVDGVTSNIQTQIDNIDALPSQTGNANKFLTTDGTNASWDAVDVSSEITGTLPVANGGTGATTLSANNVLLGNGTSAPLAVAPSTSGNVLTSNGTTWESVAPAGGGFSNIAVFTTSGTWTIPSGITTCKVTVTGAGGGSGDPSSGGGGAGGTAIKIVSLSGSTATITIGAGASNAAGGNTTFVNSATTITGNGGNAGTGGSSNAGGTGGTASGGDINIEGGGGQGSMTGYPTEGGVGGSSYWGGGGRSRGNGGGSNGVAYGSGGGGSKNDSQVLTLGANGIVVIEY